VFFPRAAPRKWIRSWRCGTSDERRVTNEGRGEFFNSSLVIRHSRRGGSMNTLWQDLRYGLRMLWRSPGLTAVVVLSLALGIGARRAVFTLVESYVFEKFPVEHPARLVAL